MPLIGSRLMHCPARAAEEICVPVDRAPFVVDSSERSFWATESIFLWFIGSFSPDNLDRAKNYGLALESGKIHNEDKL
jgi:hypothetical protein